MSIFVAVCPGSNEFFGKIEQISQKIEKNYSEHSQSPFTAMESSLALVTTARVDAMLMLKNIIYY